jgi:deoxynucleoside triphosphate triphosphohydrolase SAMHD1
MNSLPLLRSESNPQVDDKFFSDPNTKLFQDNIHDSIRIQKDILKLIHTPEFQRLHNIKQLGFCYYVYPNAVHTRFIHSVGVCYLAYVLCMAIRSKYPNKTYDIPEMKLESTKLTNDIIFLIMVAGLLHDVGHGPGSHAWDDILLKDSTHRNKTHEARSIDIMRRICKRKLNRTEEDCDFVASLIKPGKNHKGVLYQIISNELNGLDVDKFDYLRRDPVNIGLDYKFNPSRVLQEFIIDSNDNIAYAKHVSVSILDCFLYRYKLHKIAYNHKTVKIIECMFADILKLLDPIFHISQSIENIDEFIEYTDEKIYIDLRNALKNPEKYTEEEKENLHKAMMLYKRIWERELYKCVIFTENTTVEKVEEFIEPYLSELFVISTVEIGYSSSRKPDPFSKIYFYDNPNEPTFTLKKTDIDSMISPKCNITKVLCICKDRSLGTTLRKKWISDNE